VEAVSYAVASVSPPVTPTSAPLSKFDDKALTFPPSTSKWAPSTSSSNLQSISNNGDSIVSTHTPTVMPGIATPISSDAPSRNQSRGQNLTLHERPPGDNMRTAITSVVVLTSPSFQYFDDTQRYIFKLSLVDSVSTLVSVNQIVITAVIPTNTSNSGRRLMQDPDVDLRIRFRMEILTLTGVGNDLTQMNIKNELLAVFTGFNDIFMTAFNANIDVFHLEKRIHVNKYLSSESVKANTLVATNTVATVLDDSVPTLKPTSARSDSFSNDPVIQVGPPNVKIFCIASSSILGLSILLLGLLYICRTRMWNAKRLDKSLPRAYLNDQADWNPPDLDALKPRPAAIADSLFPSAAVDITCPDSKTTELEDVDRTFNVVRKCEHLVSVRARADTIHNLIREIEQKQASMQGNNDRLQNYHFYPSGHRLEPQLRCVGPTRTKKAESESGVSPSSEFKSNQEINSVEVTEVHGKLADFMEDAGLSEFTKILLGLGVDSIEDIANVGVASDSDLSIKVGMTRKQIKTLRKSLSIRRGVQDAPRISRRMKRPDDCKL